MMLRKRVSQKRIAKRAYELWQQRGCPLSDGTEDWTAAEVELKSSRRTLAPRTLKMGSFKKMGSLKNGIVGLLGRVRRRAA